MCGICGIHTANTSPEELRSQVTTMSNVIEHRGPDGEGVFVADSIALGHRRLSIIDLGGGDQPIFNEDQSICIVFNGEIYNYRELREDLIRRGHQFRTSSDTEVIVHLYEEHGIDCVKKLNGMFAFAIWDANKDRLFISRDRLGEKPLYYAYNNQTLIFGSELKALLSHPECRPELDLEVLEMYLSYGYVPEPYCIYKGIRKLPAANSLTLENNSLNLHRYWSLPELTGTDKRPFEVVRDELELLIRDSIRLRLRSDVPVGAFLSGGIDSSLIVALAAEESESQLQTFSVGFTEQDYDELKYAKMVADRYGTNHHEIFMENLDPDLFPKLVTQFDEPFSDPSAIPTYYVTGSAAKNVKVCISGNAGDELFCGYSRYNREPMEKGFEAFPNALRQTLFNGSANLLPNSFPGKGRMRRAAETGSRRWQRMVGPFDFFERMNLYNEEHKHLAQDSVELFKPYFEGTDLDEISSRMLADQRTYLPDDILVKVDRNSMWHSLEVRVPFLDHRIVEFANQLPFSFKNQNGIQKHIIKEVLKGKVPNEIMTRPKKGFGLPLKYWLKDSLKNFSREMLDSSDSRIHQYLDRKEVSRLIDQHSEGHRDLSKRIWTLLWLEQWCRQYSI